MHVRSLALATELELARTRGTVIDRGDYLVVATPDDPGYYFGNLLVLPAAPQVGEVAYWTRRFADELGKDPAIRHVAFRWDGTRGDTGAHAELVAAGFQVEVNDVMIATEVTAPPVPAIELRALAPDELAAIADLAYAIGDRHDEVFRAFLHRRVAWHRSLAERGLARFWGAFDAGALVGSLGLVPLGDRARYQDVQTAASHRGRGIAGALLAAAAAAASVDPVVIVAEPGSAAARVYTRVGFRVVEHTAAACRRP